MEQNKNDKKGKPYYRKNNRKRKPQQKGDKNLKREPKQKQAPQNYPDCPICSRAVRNLNIAIEDKTTGKPAHFECIVRDITSREQLGPNERIHYLGSGCFGIIKLKEGKGLSGFTIQKRIQYENNDKKSEWRRDLCRHVHKKSV